MSNREGVIRELSAAQSRVTLLGVVALDIEWEELAPIWAANLRENPEFRVEVFCESDNFLFAKSFTCDIDRARRRRSFRELKFIRDRAFELIDLIIDQVRTSLDAKEVKRRVNVQIMYLPIPASVAIADDTTWASPSLDEINDEFMPISPAAPWGDAIAGYVSTYMDADAGLKYAAPREEEALELYDHNRITRGIYPRRSFYDTDFSQLVVWALIFDRSGKLLIHRRADNAKDNQRMWDKSVGGHVDFSVDLDSSRAAVREVIEELFEDETAEAGGLRPFTVQYDDMINLGDWRPDRRRRTPFAEIARYSREWVFFRLREPAAVFSPRKLPSGADRRLRVIADIFLIIGGRELTDEELSKLKNSQYRLVELPDLKTYMDRGLRFEPVPELEADGRPPSFTPDLVNIMTGSIRDILEEFAQNIKRYIK